MITGSIVAIVTPMADDGSVDISRMTNILEWHLQNGTDSIVAVGTTGESATLSVTEHLQVIEHVVDVVAGRIPVIAGTGANSTTEAIEWTAAAKKSGADACLLVTPYYNKPNQQGLYEHYRALAEAVDIPQILYNVPGRTACDMLPETVYKLSLLENIVGIKEATGKLERGKEIMAQCSADFALYSGDDAIAMELMLAGAKGNISVTANIAPKQMHQLCDLAMKGEVEAAKAINDKISDLHQHLFLESNPIPVKWAMEQMGLIGSGIRLPLVRFDEKLQPTLQASMITAGIL